MDKLELADIWAKTAPFQSVETHAIISGIVAQRILTDYLSEGTLRLLCSCLNLEKAKTIQFIGYLTSLHDIGKIEPHFQAKDETMRTKLQALGLLKELSFAQSVRHEKTTGYILSKLWRDWAEQYELPYFYADILASHHQRKTEYGKQDSKNPWRSLREELECNMRSRFFDVEEDKVFGEVQRAQQSVLSALLFAIVILADWISSGSQFSDAESWIHDDIAEQIVQERVRQFLTVSGLAHQPVDWGASFSAIWPNIPSNGLRALQEKTQQLFLQTNERISVVLMEAPMGEGKTEAGLYAALQMAQQWQKDGFYVALPTAATSNQMVGRMRELLAMHNCSDRVKLLHGMAWLTDETTQQFDATDDLAAIRQWLLPRKRGLLAPYAVGTVDQAMMAVCNVKYGALRLLGLSQKVLIIDEIHSYDVYMSRFIHLLVQWCKALEIPVVLLSATLPPDKKKELLAPYSADSLSSAYPAITAITEGGRTITLDIPNTAQNKTVSIEISPHLHEPEYIAQLAEACTQQGGCICVLLNTVDQAQAVYRELKKRHSQSKLLLFHARFPAKRRAEIEQECVRLFGKDKSHRPERAILVATQVVEQSLDVDFDGMISAFAPTDLLLQRMGRVFRHADTIRPEAFQTPRMILLVPAIEKNWEVDGVIYPDCLLNQAYYLLNQRTQVRIPEDMQALVADGYDMQKAPEEELDKWIENKLDEQIAATSATVYQINPPDGSMYSGVATRSPFNDDEDSDSFLAAKTRLSEPTVQVALLDDALYAAYQKASGAKSLPLSLTRKIMEQVVSLQKKKVYGTASCLSDPNYDKFLNVKVLHIQNGCASLSETSTLTYDPEIGVQIVKDGEHGKTSL